MPHGGRHRKAVQVNSAWALMASRAQALVANAMASESLRTSWGRFQQGHGIMLHVFHCIKPTLVFCFCFQSLPMSSLWLLSPQLLFNFVVIYVVLWTTSNPLGNQVIMDLNRATNTYRMDERLASYYAISSVLWVFSILFKLILIFYCKNMRGWAGDWWAVSRWTNNREISNIPGGDSFQSKQNCCQKNNMQARKEITLKLILFIT